MEERFPTNKEYDYYQIDELKRFEGTHPAIMQEIVSKQDWKFDINKVRHNFTPKEKFLFYVEKFTGKRIGEYKNYKLI